MPTSRCHVPVSSLPGLGTTHFLSLWASMGSRMRAPLTWPNVRCVTSSFPSRCCIKLRCVAGVPVPLTCLHLTHCGHRPRDKKVRLPLPWQSCNNPRACTPHPRPPTGVGPTLTPAERCKEGADRREDSLGGDRRKMKKVRGRSGTFRYTVRLCEVEGKALRLEEEQGRRHRRLPGAGRQRGRRRVARREPGRGGQGLTAESRAPN